MRYNESSSRQTTFVFFKEYAPRERVWPYIVAGLALLVADWFLFRYLCPDIHVGEVFALIACSTFAGTFVVEAVSKLIK
jgi:hypothetical protein